MSHELQTALADERYAEAKGIVTQTRKTSPAHLQRVMNIGFNRTMRFLEAMQAEGVLSAPDAGGHRALLAPAPGGTDAGAAPVNAGPHAQSAPGPRAARTARPPRMAATPLPLSEVVRRGHVIAAGGRATAAQLRDLVDQMLPYVEAVLAASGKASGVVAVVEEFHLPTFVLKAIPADGLEVGARYVLTPAPSAF